MRRPKLACLREQEKERCGSGYGDLSRNPRLLEQRTLDQRTPTSEGQPAHRGPPSGSLGGLINPNDERRSPYPHPHLHLTAHENRRRPLPVLRHGRKVSHGGRSRSRDLLTLHPLELRSATPSAPRLFVRVVTDRLTVFEDDRGFLGFNRRLNLTYSGRRHPRGGLGTLGPRPYLRARIYFGFLWKEGTSGSDLSDCRNNPSDVGVTTRDTRVPTPLQTCFRSINLLNKTTLTHPHSVPSISPFQNDPILCTHPNEVTSPPEASVGVPETKNPWY